MDDWSRISVLTSTRRANLAVPSGQPVGTLLPELTALLRDPQDASFPQAFVLTTSTGVLLTPEMSLAAAGVMDGAILHLVRENDAPTPPVVGDVTEETVADLEQRAGRWGSTSRGVTSVGVSVAAGVAATFAAATYGSLTAARALVAAVVVLVVVGAGLSLRTQRWVGTALLSSATVVAAGSLVVSARLYGWDPKVVLGVVAVLFWVAVGVIGQIAWGSRGAVIGASHGVALWCGWLILSAVVKPVEAAALVLLAAVVLLGVLPSWALSLSGLTTLDDQRAAGTAPTRARLVTSLAAAHKGLAWSVAACCTTLVIGVVYLASSGAAWPIAFTASVGAVTGLRARSFPLVIEVISAALVAIVAGVASVVMWVERSPNQRPVALAIAVAIGLVAAASSGLTPAEHVRARIRQLADRAEMLAVLALIPCLIGVFGVYTRLLHTF